MRFIYAFRAPFRGLKSPIVDPFSNDVLPAQRPGARQERSAHRRLEVRLKEALAGRDASLDVVAERLCGVQRNRVFGQTEVSVGHCGSKLRLISKHTLQWGEYPFTL